MKKSRFIFHSQLNMALVICIEFLVHFPFPLPLQSLVLGIVTNSANLSAASTLSRARLWLYFLVLLNHVECKNSALPIPAVFRYAVVLRKHLFPHTRFA
jgi:hypothetical protein